MATPRPLGCNRCWPDSPGLAWEARTSLTHAADLIDESHFHAVIRACPFCHQLFLSIFAETIDWSGGDDSQYWTQMPVTDLEAADLLRDKSSLAESQLEALGPGRRCLRRLHPSGAPEALCWSTGILIGFHD